MSAQSPLPPLLRRAPALAAGLLTVFTVVFAHCAFSRGPIGTGALALALGTALAGLLVSEVLTGGLAHLPPASNLELVGSAYLAFALFLSFSLHYLKVLPAGIESWQLVVLAVAGMTFFLHCQRGFLLLLSVDSFLDLGAFLARPSLPVVLVFAELLVILLAVLSHRERIEEARAPAAASRPWVPLRPLPVALAGVVLFLGLFLSLKSGGGRALDGILQRGPGGAAGSAPTNELDDEMPSRVQEDPFRPDAETAGHPAARRGASRMTFQRDLRIVDKPERAEAVFLYAQLRDASGATTDAGGFPLHFLTGVVSTYDGRSWSARPPAGTVRAEGDGRIHFKVAASEAPEIWLEERVILPPLPAASLFALYPVESMALDQVMVDGEGVLSRVAPSAERFRYSAASRVLDTTTLDLEAAEARHPDPAYLETPPGFAEDRTVQGIVKDLASRSKTPYGRVSAALNFFSEFRYTPDPRLDRDADPTLAFLRARRGFSQHFSSAMALLLRRLGIPARIGIGLAGGEWKESEGIYIFRRKHVQCWVEVHYDRIGWVEYDPAARSLDARGNAAEPTPAPTLPEPPRAERHYAAPALQPGTSGSSRAEAAPVPDPGPEFASYRPAGAGSLSRRILPEKNEFDALWDSLDGNPKAAAGARSGAGGTARLLSRGSGRSPFRAAVASAAAALWSLGRDLLIVFAAAMVAYQVLARVMRRRRRRLGQAGAECPQGLFLDGEERPAGRRLRETIPKGTRRRRIAELYLDLLVRFRRIGLARSAWQTPREYRAWLGERLAPALPGFLTLTDLFQDARYGTSEISPESLRFAESAHRQVVRDLRRRKR